MSARSVTLADVAAHVGVSARTVSRVVNDEGGCTAETRDKILAAIDELGYRPNLMARGLIRRTSDTIGLLANEMLDPFFPEVADGVQRAAADLGLTMFLAATNSDATEQARALRSFQGHGVEGAIVFPARDSFDDLAEFARTGLPIVVVNATEVATGMSAVSADIAEGAGLAVAHLASRGRRRIALFLDEHSVNGDNASRREAGYARSLREHDIEIDERLIVPVANSVSGGRSGVRHLVDAEEQFDAIFAYNDLMAIGALNELARLDIAVPDDIAVVGFDDIAFCEAVTPRLTSIRIERDELGRRAVGALRDLQASGESRVETIPVTLAVRDSS